MNRGPGTLRTVIIVLGSSWLPLLLNILRVLVLPTKLGDEGMGQITLAISFTTFFGIFTSLGTSTYLVRAVAQDRQLAGRYISNALLLRLVMGLGVLGLLMGIASLLGYSPETTQIIFILACNMLIFTVSNVFESGLQALGQMGWRAIAVAIGQMTATCVGVGMLLLGADAVLYALSLPLGMAIQLSIALSYYFLKHPIRFDVDRAVMRALLVGGMPLFVWGALQTAYGQIDATLLSIFAGENVVGWFGAAAQIANVLLVIPGSISAVALPVLCEMHVRQGGSFDRTAIRTMTTTLLMTAPLGAGLAISASDVLRILPYPAVFMNAAPVLALLALALPVTGLLMMLGAMAIAIGQERKWVKISVFAVCIFPPLYVSLIWLFQTNMANGAIGAALANLIGESALVVWAWIVLPRELRHTEVMQKGLQIGALTLIMATIVALLQHFGVPLFIYIPVGATIYLAGAWLLRLITQDDLRVVRSALTKRRRTPAEAGIT